MIFVWLSLLLFVIWIDRLCRLSRANDALETEYKLYRLRDELRESAIAGRINPRNWVYRYIDSSISKSIDVRRGSG